MSSYIFKSSRLGFRNWIDSDLLPMCRINGNENVMLHFPSIQNESETAHFISRMQSSFKNNAYCYFAVEIIETKEFIGFIGLLEQNYKSKFTPYIDIGWRLDEAHWGKGYATEGAKACLNYGFSELGLTSIKSVAPVLNESSINVMRKIDLKKCFTFLHPLLNQFDHLEECVMYEINK